MDAFSPSTLDGHKHVQHHVEDYFTADEAPHQTKEEPPPPEIKEEEVWADAVAPVAEGTESQLSGKSRLPREVERMVDQLYESTWNLKVSMDPCLASGCGPGEVGYS
jgi:hypothetical protein